jgi:hypothetical protein
MKILHGLLIVAVACSLAASTAQAGSEAISSRVAHHAESADLIVKRAANFGNEETFNLFIDGVYAANVGYGRRYEARLSPGEHEVTIQPVPNFAGNGIRFAQQRISLAPGRTSIFTVVWTDGGEQPVLVKS